MNTLTSWTPDQVSAGAAVFSTVGLVVSLFLALRQLKSAQALREDEARPYVIVDLDYSHGTDMVYLVVANIGKTEARAVQLSFEPPLVQALPEVLRPGAQQLMHSSLLRTGIPEMPPGKRVVAVFDYMHLRVEEELPLTHNVRVEYKDRNGKALTSVHVIDLEHMRGTRFAKKRDSHDIAEELRMIRQLVWKDIASSE